MVLGVPISGRLIAGCRGLQLKPKLAPALWGLTHHPPVFANEPRGRCLGRPECLTRSREGREGGGMVDGIFPECFVNFAASRETNSNQPFLADWLCGRSLLRSGVDAIFLIGTL
jgi:hypothetical protein